MTPLEFAIAVFGGNVALLAVLGWLARSLGQHLLTKDIARFKTELSSAAAVQSEQLKHSLQLISVEHQITYAKLHETRARIIGQLYKRLVHFYRAAGSFLSSFDAAGDPSKKEKLRLAENAGAELFVYFDERKVWLPESICQNIENLLFGIRKEVTGFGVHWIHDDELKPPQAVQAKYDAWFKAARFLDEQMPAARASLEKELRTILGVAAS